MVRASGSRPTASRRWLGAGPLQFQPSELAKLALVLYAAMLIAGNRGGCARCTACAR